MTKSRTTNSSRISGRAKFISLASWANPSVTSSSSIIRALRLSCGACSLTLNIQCFDTCAEWLSRSLPHSSTTHKQLFQLIRVPASSQQCEPQDETIPRANEAFRKDCMCQRSYLIEVTLGCPTLGDADECFGFIQFSLFALFGKMNVHAICRRRPQSQRRGIYFMWVGQWCSRTRWYSLKRRCNSSSFCSRC